MITDRDPSQFVIDPQRMQKSAASDLQKPPVAQPEPQPARGSQKFQAHAGTLPFEAERMLSRQRKFNEVVVFVHHFGGDRRTVLRHVRLVNELGYDAIRFDLMFNQTRPSQELPITGDFKFGVRHVWANQIEAILNSTSEHKILYTFSMPSASAFEALGRRRGQDVTGMICDGGPFLQLLRCTWNLYEHEYHVKSRLLRAAFTAFSISLWGLDFERQMKKFLGSLPSEFRVLSIRGGNDPLVPNAAIDDFFRLEPRLQVERLFLPEGQHLDGLKRHAKEYVPKVEKFLSEISTKI